jgi:hypothetical protein
VKGQYSRQGVGLACTIFAKRLARRYGNILHLRVPCSANPRKATIFPVHFMKYLRSYETYLAYQASSLL